MTTELMPKRLELLKEVVPKASRVTFLQDPEAATNAFELIQEAAPRLGIKLQSAQVAADEELRTELTTDPKEHPDALLVYPDVVLSSLTRDLSSSPTSLSRPTCPRCMRFVFTWTLAVSCPTARPQSEIYTSAAEQVAKILDGTRPSELPLRQATRFELVINLKTAKALGLTIPPSVLLRADEVIE